VAGGQCGSVTTITRNCVQTGFVGKGNDHLQLIKFWPSRAPGKGVCSRAKIFGSALLQPAHSVCVSSEHFFHLNCFMSFHSLTFLHRNIWLVKQQQSCSRVFQELSVLCSTIDESWDQDPEARLSAECIEARLSQIYHSPSVSDVSVSSLPGSSDAKEKVSLVV